MEHKDISTIKPSFLGALSVLLFLCITLTVQVILYGTPEIHITFYFPQLMQLLSQWLQVLNGKPLKKELCMAAT